MVSLELVHGDGLHPMEDGGAVFRVTGLHVAELQILRIQGYKDMSRVRPIIKSAASNAAREAEACFDAHVFCRCVRIRHCGSSRLELENGTCFESPVFDRFLLGADGMFAFVLTMGEGLDRAVAHSIEEERLLNAVLLETAGWLGVESATKSLAAHLTAIAGAEGRRISRRLGPGYSYRTGGSKVHWPLAQQKLLFQMFEDLPMGVELTESSVMVPKFSRSGIYGIQPAAA